MLISFSAIAEVMAKGIPLGIHAYKLYSVLWSVNSGEFSDVSEPPKDCSNKVYQGFPQNRPLGSTLAQANWVTELASTLVLDSSCFHTSLHT